LFASGTVRFVQYLALLAAFALTLSLGAFAKEANSGNFDIGQNARIGRTFVETRPLQGGGDGPNNALNVKIIEHGKTVATTKGHLKELPAKSPYSTVEFLSDKSPQVDEIDFNNRTEAPVLAGS
jgi:hypothetical protein